MRTTAIPHNAIRAGLLMSISVLASVTIQGSAPHRPPARSPFQLRNAPMDALRSRALEAGGSYGWASYNWSGYAVAGQYYLTVTGRWTVPAVSKSSSATFSSAWIGIDGFENNALIQTGTESDYYGGRPHYDAWWEILPAPEAPITGMNVSPGDLMSASINETTPTSQLWTIAISDVSKRQSFVIQETYSGPRSSAEWVIEAPTVNGAIAPLARYSPTTFDPGTQNGNSPGFTAADGGVMIQGRKQVSTPSSPDVDADGFAARYGSRSPGTPSS